MDWFLATRPLDNDIYCGDAGLVKAYDDKLFLAVVDALGHGKEAQQQARASLDFLSENFRQPLVEMMEGLHRHLHGGRGVVASLCLLDGVAGRLSYVSVGDTLVRKLNHGQEHIITMPGVIGYQIRSQRDRTLPVAEGDVLLLHSDGIPAHFDSWDEGLLQGDARAIAEGIIARYGKLHDDNICIVVKCDGLSSMKIACC